LQVLASGKEDFTLSIKEVIILFGFIEPSKPNICKNWYWFCYKVHWIFYSCHLWQGMQRGRLQLEIHIKVVKLIVELTMLPKSFRTNYVV